MDNPNLSIVMIVRDEQELLRQCLESVRPLYENGGELVIVDTGSQDDTIHIAREYTTRVYEHPWQDSFAEARNYAATKATGDWIFVVDADEAFFEEDAPILWEALHHAEATGVEALLIPILSELGTSRIAKHYFPRVYKRGAAEFEGIVHNQLVYAGQDMVVETRLWHYGYNLSPEERRAKQERSRRLLERQLETLPEGTDRAFAWMNLIRIWRQWGQQEDVVKKVPELLAGPHIGPQHYHSLTSDLLLSLMLLGRSLEAERVGLEALERMPDSLDFLYYVGGFYLDTNRPSRAIPILQRFLQIKKHTREQGPEFHLMVYDQYEHEGDVWHRLGLCYNMLNDYVNALRCFQQAVRCNPDDEASFHNIARLAQFMQQGGHRRAEPERETV